MIRSNGPITIQGKGTKITFERSSLKPGAKLQQSLDHLLAGGDPKELPPGDLKKLGAKKSLLGKGADALIIRFDVKIVRIDEKLPIDLGKIKMSGK